MLCRDQQAEDDDDAEPERRHRDAGNAKGAYDLVYQVFCLMAEIVPGNGDNTHDRCDNGDFHRQLEPQRDFLGNRFCPHRRTWVKTT